MAFPDGEDVASYQSSNFDTTNLEFVFVKATEGTNYVNPRHSAQVAHGRSKGLVIGHYHFVRSGSMPGQVDYFLKNAAPKPGDILALDWEDVHVTSADKDAWIKDCKGKSPTHRTILYCNRDFWLNRDHSSNCGDGLWIADPNRPAGSPNVTHEWRFHQFSEAGGVDRDVANFTSKQALAAWAGATQPPVAHAPSYEPFPGEHWFTVGRSSPIVTAMHNRLVAEGCGRYRSHTNLNVIGSGDKASYEAWQHKYNSQHHKGWSGAALQWPPGKETWDALHVPNV